MSLFYSELNYGYRIDNLNSNYIIFIVFSYLAYIGKKIEIYI